MRKPEPRDELAAAHIVEGLSDCVTRRLDFGGGATQLADYALDTADGTQIGLLEVTSITDQVLEGFFASRGARQVDHWGEGYLARNWLVRVRDASVMLDPLQTTLVQVLRDLERDGVEHAYAEPTSYTEEVVPLPTDVVAAGFVEIQALPRRDTERGRIFFNVISGGAYGIETLTVAVEERTRCADNRAKLSGEWTRRELFMWVQSWMPRGALTAFCSEAHAHDVANARAPTLPPEITAVWAAVWTWDRDGALTWPVWRGDRSGWAIRPGPGHLHS